jgi:hypothetical protein
MKTKVIFVLFAFLLSGSLIAADRSHNSKDPCKQIADKQRQKACKEKYLAFQLCRHNYRKCNFATLGDSLTDEYQGHSNLAGLNWVEQIVCAGQSMRGEEPPVSGDTALLRAAGRAKRQGGCGQSPGCYDRLGC